MLFNFEIFVQPNALEVNSNIKANKRVCHKRERERRERETGWPKKGMHLLNKYLVLENGNAISGKALKYSNNMMGEPPAK